MHRFKCKVQGGVITPLEPNKADLLRRVLADYEQRNITVTVTLEVAEKNINDEQYKLYKAFIMKAADHFGNDFRSMQEDLKHFWPEDEYGLTPPSKWTSTQLDIFINKASAHLAQFGFHF